MHLLSATIHNKCKLSSHFLVNSIRNQLKWFPFRSTQKGNSEFRRKKFHFLSEKLEEVSVEASIQVGKYN